MKPVVVYAAVAAALTGSTSFAARESDALKAAAVDQATLHPKLENAIEKLVALADTGTAEREDQPAAAAAPRE